MVKDTIVKSCSPKGHLIEGAAAWKIQLPAGDFYCGECEIVALRGKDRNPKVSLSKQ